MTLSRANATAEPRQIRGGWRRVIGPILALLLSWRIAGETAMALDFADNFADRQLTTARKGKLTGTTVLATRETNEPRHGGRPGGHSVWLSWRAPEDGIVTFDTQGSRFDTLLSAYVLEPGARPPLERLREAARGDDNQSATLSVIQFGAISNTVYEIAVDGFNGEAGEVQLNWELAPSADPPPVILNVPEDRALQVGETLTLTVDFTPAKSTKFSWFYNGTEIPNQEGPTLVLPNFQPANVGHYSLRITADKIRFFTREIEIQINSEGLTTVLARNKLWEAPDSGLRPDDDRGGRNGLNLNLNAAPSSRARARLQAAPAGVARGYTGTQIFNTVYSTRDPAEPAHCGLAGGSSYWFAYQAPTNGVMTLDTGGSGFDTVLAVYTYAPPILSYQGLIPVACDDNGGADQRTSRVQFKTELNRNYLVVIDGVQGARGVAYLNYALTALTIPELIPPKFTVEPVDQLVGLGATATFSTVVTGTEPIHYLWRHNELIVTNADTATLNIPGTTQADDGFYTVLVSNPAGSITSRPVRLQLVQPPQILSEPVDQVVVIGGIARFAVIVSGIEPIHFSWRKGDQPLAGSDSAVFTISPVALVDDATYSVVASSLGGMTVSRSIRLRVVVPPKIINGPKGIAAESGTAVTLASLAEGTPPLRYRWFKDQTLLSTEARESIEFPAVTPEQAGLYQVEVQNEAGTVTSEPAAVAVWSRPEVLWNSAHSELLTQFTAAGSLRVLIETATEIDGPWLSLPAPFPSTNGLVRIPFGSDSPPGRWLRIRVESTNGTGP